MNTVDYWQKLYQTDHHIREAHLHMFEKVDQGTITLDASWDLSWVTASIALDQPHIAHQVLEARGLPKGLSIKEKLALLELGLS